MFTAFFAQTFRSSLIVVDYYTNTQAFADKCENKANPELHCNGKCQMHKQLNNEEKKDQQNPERKDNKSEIIFSSKSSYSLKSSLVLLQLTNYPIFSERKEIKMPRSILRPPIV